MPAEENRRVLNQSELELLTDAWSIWVDNATTPGRRLTRLRLHLFFLLARFGGLRLAEISVLEAGDIDVATGCLRLRDRTVFLPVSAMRSIRRILALAEAAEPGFLQVDAGFLRRAFYNVGERAGLPPALCAPRALRYARAHELLAMGMPLDLVASALGFKNPLHLANQLQMPDCACRGYEVASNMVTGLILGLDTGLRSARLVIELAPRLLVQAVRPLQDLLAVEPKAGGTVAIHIPPACIFPASNFPECENQFNCRLISSVRDQFEIRLTLALAAHLHLGAVMNPLVTDFTSLNKGENFPIHIPPHLIQLR